MPIKVPTYENQAEAAQGHAPNVSPISQPPATAFGTDVYREAQRLGDTGLNVADKLNQHMVERERQAQETEILDRDTQFRKDLQGLLINPGTDENGIPKGMLSRELGQAKGSTMDYDNQAGALREKYLSAGGSPFQQQSLSRMMDQSLLSSRESVISHEARQENENSKNILESNLSQRVSDAAGMKNPKDLVNAIKEGSYVGYAGMKRMGFDDKTIAVKLDKYSGEMAKSAMETVIAANPYTAQKYFDQIKTSLSPGQQTDIQKYILVAQRQFEELLKYQKQQVYDSNMRTAMLDMFNGKLTLSEAQRLYANDTLSETDYGLLEGKLVKPDYTGLNDPLKKSDPTAYNEIREAQLSGSRTPGEITRMIARGGAEGTISPTDGPYLDKLNKNLPPSPTDSRIESHAASIRNFGDRYIYDVPATRGVIEEGNIDLSNRPRVQNPDGSISTVRSMSFNSDGKEILVPTVSPEGKNMTPDEAIAEYRKTGKHLGIFKDEKSANAYAEALHKQQAAAIGEEGFLDKITGFFGNKKEKSQRVETMISDFYSRVDKENAQGQRIDEIAREVMSDYTKKDIPEISRLEDLPHVVVNIDGSVQRLLNPNQKTKLRPNYRLTPVTPPAEKKPTDSGDKQ